MEKEIKIVKKYAIPWRKNQYSHAKLFTSIKKEKQFGRIKASSIHFFAALAVAYILILPAIRSFWDVSEQSYVFAGIFFCLIAFSFERNRVLGYWQLFWWFFLGSMLVYLLLVSFPFENPGLVTQAAPFLLTTLALGFLCSMNWSESFFYTVVWMVIIAGMFFSLGVSYGFFLSGGDFRKIFDAGYLTLGTILSLSFCMTLPFFFFYKGKKKILYFLPVCICGFGVIVCLSRGALLFSSFVALMLTIFYWPQSMSKKSLLASITTRLFFVAVFVVTFISYVPSRTLGRLDRLFAGDELGEGGRGRLWLDAVNRIFDAPFFGHGLGEASIATIYPHNLFLQVGIDGGLPAIILLMLIVSLPLIFFYKSYKFVKNDPLPVALLSSYIWSLFEYSKSGDFYKSRSFFIFISLLVGFLGFQYKKRKKRYSYKNCPESHHK